ncbi:MAG: hypothetical protein U9N87_13035 [Planctomycetota bacterium]|nr:hypothetical protein [Planctomycetota bacterium]
MKCFYPKAVALLLVLSTPLLCACGSGRPDTHATKGKVVFPDGSPLPGGTIMFQSIGAKGETVYNARGLIKQDGTFAMTTFEPNDGAVGGEHRVLVRESAPVGDFTSPSANAKLVDPRFMSFDTSGITVNVKEEDNDLIIKIDRPATRR